MAALGLGLAALGRPGYMTLGHAGDLPGTSVEAMAAHAARLLDTAYWRADADVHEVKDHSLAHLEAQWPESKALLGPYLRVYQVHSATLESGVLSDGAVLDRLARLRDDEGVEVGLSVTGPRQAEVIDAARVISRGGRRLFAWVQATWNVLEPSAGPALARAHAEGLRVDVARVRPRQGLQVAHVAGDGELVLRLLEGRALALPRGQRLLHVVVRLADFAGVRRAHGGGGRGRKVVPRAGEETAARPAAASRLQR